MIESQNYEFTFCYKQITIIIYFLLKSNFISCMF